jgi:hypothetical protein
MVAPAPEEAMLAGPPLEQIPPEAIMKPPALPPEMPPGGMPPPAMPAPQPMGGPDEMTLMKMLLARRGGFGRPRPMPVDRIQRERRDVVGPPVRQIDSLVEGMADRLSGRPVARRVLDSASG